MPASRVTDASLSAGGKAVDAPVPEPVPAEFAEVLAALRSLTARPEIELTELPPPQRLAPWSHAIAATVYAAAPYSDSGGNSAGGLYADPRADSRADSCGSAGADVGTEIGSGRLVVLYDPDGVSSWNGTIRFVVFATCDVEGEIARDPLLPDVGWSWLIDALENCGATYTALGGTVTATSSLRFGDMSSDPRSDDVEIRASWTAVEGPYERHLAAFAALLAVAAGLAPEGVSAISPIRPVSRC